MTYMPTKSTIFSSTKAQTGLDAYYDQRKQNKETSIQLLCSYCSQLGHLKASCPLRTSHIRNNKPPKCDKCGFLSHETTNCLNAPEKLTGKNYQDNPDAAIPHTPTLSFQTLTFHDQTQSEPATQISQAPQHPTKPERFELQPASNIMLHELTKARTAYNKSKQFRKPVPTKYTQLNTTTTLQFYDTMFRTTTTIEHTIYSRPHHHHYRTPMTQLYKQ